jgi:multidrug efflux system membrane fusion protein
MNLKLRAPVLLLLPFLLSFALLIQGCSETKTATAKPAGPDAFPISVTKAASKIVPLEIQAVGNVEPYSTITVKALIGGELTRVAFQEGAAVKKGDTLFVVDPRPYESQVAQAEATVNKDKAQLHAAEANLARDIAQQNYANEQSQRYSKLFEKGIATKDSSDQIASQATALSEAVRADRAAIESAQANLVADQTAIDRAKLQLEYCTIKSPIDGRTGHLFVKQGNVVKATDMDLVTINQIHPILVNFAVPEIDLPAIKSHMSSGPVQVVAYSEGDTTAAETGKLTFIENTVDSTTGTIRLKGEFQNAGAKLWPGQYVRVVVRLNTSTTAVVVPLPAVQTGQDGKFVFVVKPDMTVEARPVTQGRALEREVVIEKGLSEGETVVTEGQLRLAPGSHVQIKQASAL